MVKISPHLDVDETKKFFDTLHKPDGPAKVLEWAADFIRLGKPIPHPIGNYVAGAFEGLSEITESEGKTAKRNQGHELLKRLAFIQSAHAPKNPRWIDIAREMDWLANSDGYTEHKAAKEVGAKFGVSPDSAKRFLFDYLRLGRAR